jgi:uncharacterized protein
MSSHDRVSYLDFGRRVPPRPVPPRPPKRSTARPELIARFERAVGGHHEECAEGYRLIGRRAHPLDERYGPVRLGDLLGLPPTVLASLARDDELRSADLHGLTFVDCETTGLAGGTGTKAFLVGIAYFGDDGLTVEQHFLPDYDLEPAFLGGVGAALDRAGALVTFNGKCFDVPLLETRFALARRRADWLDLPHLDMLHPSRRMWRRRLASCSLTSLEEQVLGVRRESDLPGWLIPTVYFQFLRTGDFTPLEVVFEHNRRDLLGLVALTLVVARLVGGEEEPADTLDLYSLGRYLEDLGEHGRSAACYRRALEVGLGAAERAEAHVRLAVLHRRAGDRAAEVAEWEALVGSGEPMALLALVELAKHYEHRARDFPLALEATRRALLLSQDRPEVPPSGELTPTALERRLWRLEARASGAWRRTPLVG